MRKLLVFLCFLSSLALAQTTTLTGTIQDPNGQTFNSGACFIQFQPTPGTPGPYNLNGVNLTPAQMQPACSLSGAGVISGTVSDNKQINPSGSKWIFTVCPNATVPCTSVALQVTGASQNVATTINTQIPVISLPPLVALPRAYQDSQVTPLNQGSQYWNVTNQNLEIWNGSLWSTFPLASGNNTWSGTNTFNGNVNLNGTNTANVLNIKYPGPCDLVAFGGKANDNTFDNAALINTLSANCNYIALKPAQSAAPGSPTIYYFGQSVNGAMVVDCVDPNLVLVKNQSAFTNAALFQPTGTAGTHLSMFTLKNCGLQNGVASGTSPGGSSLVAPNGIVAQYVDKLKIQNNRFINIAGYFAMFNQYNTDVTITDNTCESYYFSCHQDGVEVDTELFMHNGNLVDPTCIGGASCSGGNAYFDENGYLIAGGLYFVKHKQILFNNCRSNTLWECFGTHGGEDLIWMGNTGNNSRFGIQVGNVTGIVTNTLCKHMVLIDNYMYQGTGTNNGFGIVVNGTDETGPGVCQDVTLLGNYTNGFGEATGGTFTTAAYTFYNTEGVQAFGNRAENSKLGCVNIWYSNYDLKIDGFKCKNIDVAHSSSATNTFALRTRVFGNSAYINDFTLETNASANAPQWFYRQDVQFNNIQFGTWKLIGYPAASATWSINGGAQNLGAAPTLGMYKKGDCATDTTGLCRWTPSFTTDGYFSPSAVTVATVDCVNGSNLLTYNTASGGVDTRALMPGTNISVANCAAGPAALVTTVLSNPGTFVGGTTQITVKDNATNTNTNQAVTIQASGAFTDVRNSLQTNGNTITTNAIDSPGALVIAANSCTNRSVTISGVTATSTVSVAAGYVLEANLILSAGQAAAGGVNFRICNPTAAGITLAAGSTFNIKATF